MRERVRGPVGWLVGLGLVCLAAGAAGGWAVREVAQPPAALQDEASYTTVSVVDGEVGRSINLNAEVSWQVAASAPVRADGVVTSVDVTPGQEVAAGEQVLSVGLRPVVVAQGVVPSFRDLARGAKGADVTQLQTMLSGLGHLAAAPDGDFGAATDRAVRAWQRAQGVEVTGTVLVGDVVYLPQLPARVSPGEDLSVGADASAAGGIVVLGAEPDVSIPLQEGQLDLVAPGMAVTLTAGEGSWQAEVASTGTTAQGAAFARLEGAGGQGLCAVDCTWVPATGTATAGVVVEIVPSVSGPLVPAAAITTDAEGQTFVLTGAGERREVRVVGASGGQAVVDGVVAGEVVRSPGEES